MFFNYMNFKLWIDLFLLDGSWELEVGSWKLEVGRWELGDGSLKLLFDF